MGGWVAPGEGASVSTMVPGVLAGHRSAGQDCEKLFKASRASSLLPRHRNDC